jgi:hypothetical protein
MYNNFFSGVRIVGYCFLFGAVLILSGSCLGPKKIDKWVDQKYAGTLPVQPKKANDYLSIKSTLVSTDDNLSNTTKKTSKVLPLIFYWQFDYKNTCTLNPQIPISNFTKTAIPYANRKGLKQKLNGRTIELSIDKLPNMFAINDRGHVIWFIYAFGWDVLTIFPENNEMLVSYRVLDNGQEVRKGIISIADSLKPVTLKMMQSLKKRTWQFLDDYEVNITAMSKLAIDKLIAEL